MTATDTTAARPDPASGTAASAAPRSGSRTSPRSTPARTIAAVDGLSLVIPAGEIVMFVGPSGCGKTTSLKMINRLIEPTSGTIHIGDNDISGQSADQLRRHIGYVIQGGSLFPHMTVAKNIAIVPKMLGWEQDRIDEARRRAARAGQPRPGEVPRPLPARALRWPAAARRRRPRTGRRPAGDPDGRAVRRGRPDHPPAAAGRAALDPARAAQDDRLRHPRHRRGDQARRPDPDPPGGRAGRAVRHPRGDPGQPGQRLRRRLRGRRLLAQAAQPVPHLRGRAASPDHGHDRRDAPPR